MWVWMLLLVGAVTATDSDNGLYKCCGPNSSLRKDNVTGDLICDVTASPLQVDGAQVRHGIPECCNSSLIKWEKNTSLPSSHNCIDKEETREDTVQSASVIAYVWDDGDSVSNLTSPTVINIKKCCVNGTYDPSRRICRDTIDGQEILQKPILRDPACFVNVEYGLWACGPSEAVVTLTVRCDNIELLTNGTVVVNTSSGVLTPEDGAFCMDSVVNSSNSVVIKFCQSISERCTQSPCVQKCCRDGYGLIHNNSCVSSNFDFNPQFYNVVPTGNGYTYVQAAAPSFAVLSNLNCEKYVLQPETKEQDKSYLAVDGSLHVPGLSDHFTTDKYCIERLVLPEMHMDGIYSFLCFPNDSDEHSSLPFILCAVGLITSSVFLLITFLVYACLPSLQNLHGKTLMCHVVSLFAAYVCLSVAQLGGQTIDSFFCAALGYCVLCTFLAAFSWLNVMCFDIWWTFGVIRSVGQGVGCRKQRERRRFAVYSIYAWGLPSVLTAITAAMDVPGLSPATLKPNMGVNSCWFSKDTYGIAVYFLGPVAPMVTCNVVLFLLTARSCSKVKAEIHRMQQNSVGARCKRRYQADKNKLIMNAKLFFVMGITWTLEIVSTFVTGPPWIWYLTDTANALQGALIFGIFVLKRKVIHTLAHRLGFLDLRPITRPNTTERPTTCYDPYHVRKTSSSSTLSTTITDSRRVRGFSGSCQ